VVVVVVLGGGATVNEAVGAAVGGTVTSGCVFFISTAADAFAGGFDCTAMRAVSFLGPGDGAVIVAGAALGIGGAEGGGATAPAGGAGVGREKGGGGTGFAGAGGKGVCASGGRGGAPGGGGGAVGGGRGGASFDGGRTGKFIRTVSRAPLPVAGGWSMGSGGKVMRTVSFLGSLGSAIRRHE
jgi:hypothetical protein